MSGVFSPPHQIVGQYAQELEGAGIGYYIPDNGSMRFSPVAFDVI